MARGLVSGLIWGGVIAVGGVAVLSLMTPMPAPPAVTSADPDVATPAQQQEAAEAPVSAAETSAPAQPEVQAESPEAPQTDTLAALEEADTAPTDAPSVGEAAPLAESTLTEGASPDVSAATADTDAQNTPVPDVSTPTEPERGETLSISTEPAQPTPPATATEGSGFATQAQESAEPTAETIETTEPDPTEDAGSEAPVAAETAIQAEPETPVASETTEDDSSRIAALPRVEADPATTQEEEAAPSIGQRVVPLTERDTAISGLPSVGDAATPEAEEAPEAPVAAATEDLPPIERFAAPFENPDAKPLMGIVLIDDTASIGVEALSSFPYPLSFAVDVSDPEAPRKAARHRAAGFEVMALIDLPEEATAQDAETALQAALAIVPEAIGVLEGTGSGIQGNRALSDQVTAVLRDGGFGLITQNAGLNTVQKLAQREGVPSAFVFRDFDGAGQTPTVMRRFLDQAAFRAGQEGGVVMLGRVRPDTISALLLWGLQDRASRVSLAPASAVLTRQPSGE